MWQWPKRALLISLNNDNNNRFALCLDEERLNWVCEGVRALESGGVAEGGSHYWNGWVKWAFYWGLSLANLPHVTAQPDLLPWNATGCCAEDKKRQRLKLQGCNTSWSWRAAQLCQERKKNVLRVSSHTPSYPALNHLQIFTFDSHEQQQCSLTTNHDAYAQFSPTIWGVLGDFLHPFDPPLCFCLPPSVSSAYSCSCHAMQSL